MKCDNCGKEIKDLEAFCPRCGKQLVFGDITPYQGNDRDQELTFVGYYDEDATTMGEEPIYDEKPVQEEPPQKDYHENTDDPNATVMGEEPIRVKDPQKADRVIADTPDASDFSEEPTFVEHSQKAYQRNTDDPDATAMGSDEIFLKSSQEEIVLPVDSPVGFVNDERKNPIVFIAIALFVVLVIGIGIFAVIRNTKDTETSTGSVSSTGTNTEKIEAETDSNKTISDSWDQIVESVNDGSYKKKYNIGNLKEIDLGTEGVIDMQIVAFDADELADGSGKAAITWISKQLINTEHRMNPPLEVDPLNSSKYLIGTGSIGGLKNSEMRSWMQSDIKPLIPSNVRNAIKPVTKYSTSYTTNNERIKNESSVDDIWIPSWREVFGSDLTYDYMYRKYESKGATYPLFDSDQDRVKKKVGESNTVYWLSRTANSSKYFSYVYQEEYYLNSNADYSYGVALGFCT